MKATGHTPGPWELHSSTEGDPRVGDGSFCITGPIGDQRGVIANIVPPDWHETPANARLIASAPALLDILEGFLNTLVTDDLEWEALLKRYFDSNIELFDFAIDTYTYILNLETEEAIA